MKKFILLFVVVLLTGTMFVQSQTLSKILGRANYPNTEFVDLATDTMKHSNAFTNTLYNFAFEYTNGSIPLDAGDVIVCDVYIATITSGNSLRFDDTLHYQLPEALAAGEKIEFEVAHGIALENNWPGAIDTDGDVTSFNIWGKIYYTSKFNVNNVQKMVKAIYKKTAPSSISESSIQSVQLFPNPVNSSLNINNLNSTKVEIFNVVGQRILTYDNASGNLNVDMTTYPNGIYFVKMQNGKSVRTEKIKLVK